MRIFGKITESKKYPNYLVEKLKEIDDLREEDHRLEKLFEEFEAPTAENTELLYKELLQSIATHRNLIKHRIKGIFTEIERMEEQR